ncbi:hypothetical protein RFI_34692, partial [Reticulomyxa filosa]
STLIQLRRKPKLEAIVSLGDIFETDAKEHLDIAMNGTSTATGDVRNANNELALLYDKVSTNEPTSTSTNTEAIQHTIIGHRPEFDGTQEQYWSCVTNLGKFLLTTLKKISPHFVKDGGVEALVQISYDPVMHPVPFMKTRSVNEAKSVEEKTSEIEPVKVKFGSAVVPGLSSGVAAAQNSITNCYQFLKKESWPSLINTLFQIFEIEKINEETVAKFQYSTLADVNGDVEELKKRHHQLAQALRLGSRITRLFSILTRLTRRGDVNIIHQSEFHKWMHCLTKLIPGILWFMTQCDSTEIHQQAAKDRQMLVGLYTDEEKSARSSQESEVDRQYYSDTFINIRHYESQIVSLMNHFTKFFKNALRIYRKAVDSRADGTQPANTTFNDKHVVEYMSHFLFVLTNFRIPRLFLRLNNQRGIHIVPFWALIQYHEYVCHIIETMSFTSHKLLVQDLLKSFVEYGGLNRMVVLFRFFTYVFGTLESSDENRPSSDLLQHQIKSLFLQAEHEHDAFEDVRIKMEGDKEIYLTDNFRSVMAQFANFWNLMMKAQNVVEIDKHLGYYVCVELTSLWKSPWFCRRRNQSSFDDFALIHKGVYVVYNFFNKYFICTWQNIPKKMDDSGGG